MSAQCAPVHKTLDLPGQSDTNETACLSEQRVLLLHVAGKMPACRKVVCISRRPKVLAPGTIMVISLVPSPQKHKTPHRTGSYTQSRNARQCSQSMTVHSAAPASCCVPLHLVCHHAGMWPVGLNRITQVLFPLVLASLFLGPQVSPAGWRASGRASGLRSLAEHA